MLSNPINSQNIFKRIRTNKNIIKKGIKYSYNIEINSNCLHYTLFHRQTSFTCLTNAYTYTQMKSLWFRAVFRHTRATRTFMDPCGLRHVYAPCGHFSLIIPYLFFPYFFPKDFIIPYIIDNRMIDSLHYHSNLYYFTTPIFSCLVNILLLFIRTISPYFTCINRVDTALYSISIWVICSLGQHLFISLETSSTAAFKYFGLYCQRLPGLTTKSTHHYPYSYYFRTTFTFIA